MKVACERLVLDGAARSMVVRPGLIVGPGDPTGRYSYWPERLAEPAAAVLGPGSPDDRVQVIDARDLAEWIVRSVESGQTGVFDGVGPAHAGRRGARGRPPRASAPRRTSCGRARSSSPSRRSSRGWATAALPLWLPRPEYDGMMTHGHEASRRRRPDRPPVADTARDTLAWLRENPDAPRTGMSREREAEVLDRWSRKARSS